MGVDEIVCATTPEPFLDVGQWYRDFSQTTDQEVRDLLEAAKNEYAAQHQELVHSS
jgi:putative phosphoribosyl transferase